MFRNPPGRALDLVEIQFFEESRLMAIRNQKPPTRWAFGFHYIKSRYFRYMRYILKDFILFQEFISYVHPDIVSAPDTPQLN